MGQQHEKQPSPSRNRRKSKADTSQSHSSTGAIARSSEFPIVGVGASAGGLEAFMQLLRALPSKLGMAFVLVPHLDPTHESAMTELLGRATRMPVLQVQHGMAVQRDHVYVIPPGRMMTIKAGVLQLSARQEHQQTMAIDVFLRSLAQDQHNNAVGVILSGTASDGTLGLHAIKVEGGITFAQDSASARYDGMPSSAVASGAVDFVLPPAKIAAELENIRRHPYLAGPDKGDLPSEVSYNLEHLLRVLKEASKVDFSDYKPATLRRRISRRMALKNLKSLGEYVKYVREHPGEAEALYQDILINVTNFFRDSDAFESLKQNVYPALLKGRSPNDPIRIWVPGCSTGEEAYSHAMALVEHLSNIRVEIPVQIFGTDLSEAAVSRARAGIYKESITADVSPARLRRFFTKTESGYQVSKTIRDLCIFARQNVFSDPPFSRMDMVSCRNLLIYLGPALQRKIIPVFHYALRPGGFLMLGNAEGLLGAGIDLFTLVDKKNKVFAKRMVSLPVNFGFEMVRQDRHWHQTETANTAHQDDSLNLSLELQKEADRMLLAKYAPAAVLVNEQLDILQSRGHTSRYLELPPGKASLNLLRMARPGLLSELQKAIEQARKEHTTVTRDSVPVEGNGPFAAVKIEINPLRAENSQNFLVVFHDGTRPPAPSAAKPQKEQTISEKEQQKQLEQLKSELAATKQYLQSIIEEHEATNEELQSANEEVQSANEELQSTNEELQTSKEELESANEELNTVNEEMQNRNVQLSQLNNDLTNLLNSVNMPIVMLGPDLSVRRYTLQAERLLGLSAQDVGRPLSNIRIKLKLDHLEKLVLDVMRDIAPKQEEFHQDGFCYHIRITPYRTSDNKIEGAVVTMLDVTERKRPAARK